jgi:hypothetical protein
MELDPELDAMSKVQSALESLDDDAKQRVLSWVVGRLQLSKTTPPSSGAKGDDKIKEGQSPKDFGIVADAFGAAAPTTDADKALVVAAYIQQTSDTETLTAQQINKELRHLGHGVSNITSAISSLIKHKPQLMLQTRKSGKSRQARKNYMVTKHGFDAVGAMYRRG